MAPTRVGIIGLSAKAPSYAPGTWASASFLPSIQNSPKYTIVALCNTSTEAARRSIQFHNLPETTKAYGDPQDLANDPDVDLVIVSVVVTHHLKLALPALQKKKEVFVEWPLGHSAAEAEQMVELAKTNGLRTIVGLQARADPSMIKLREIINSGEIGEVKNTTVVGTLPALPPQFWIEGMEQFLDIKGGAGAFHIVFGHFIDSFTHILGPFDTSSISSMLKTDNDHVPIYIPDRTAIAIPSHPKTAPDHILVQGSLQSGALATVHFRTTQASIDDVGIRWIISGSKGEVEITSPSSSWQGYFPNRKIKVKVFGGETRDVDFAADLGAAAEVGQRAVNTALVLDAFAKGKMELYADFEAGLRNHKLLDVILKKSSLEV
ncbi:oxidoreductase family protein [Colletotrichum chrysophilum]|uniref:Oxidoreductase family protein n=1 Tax=Colletotrichum chrysophilum TaxID=1836956 RepID=A0AAD9AJ98_9PEZI|nr:oxidoreductase family protein [Colletotrichum chrysophilum]